MSVIEITVFRSANGPLTKRISIAGGKIKSDGSACRMVAGTAHRVPLDSPAVAGKTARKYAIKRGDCSWSPAPRLA